MSSSRQLDAAALRRLQVAFGPVPEQPDEPSVAPAPGIWLQPEHPHQLALAIQTARAEGVPVVVRGSGSRLGAGAFAGVEQGGYLLLGTGRLQGIEQIEAGSLWARVKAGTSLAELVQATAQAGLRPVGLEDPPSGTVGGWLSTRTRIPDPILGIDQPVVAGLEAVLPGGQLVRSVQTPRAAVGPDLFSLLLGTRGAFGVILGACLKLEPLPERQLMAGFRFASTERAFGFVREALHALIMPGQFQVLVDGQRGRRMARLWFAIEGQADLAGAAMRGLRRIAEQAGGKPRELERVRAWRAASVFGKHRMLEAPVRWSRLTAVLRGADRALGGFAWALLDRPGLTGCRLRVAATRGFKGDPGPAFGRLVDPGGIEADARARCLELLGRVRQALDPGGLLNPQAWPLPWPGGAA